MCVCDIEKSRWRGALINRLIGHLEPDLNLEVHGYVYMNNGIRRLNVGHTPNSLLWVVSDVANKTVLKTRICAEMQGLTYHPREE